MSSDRAIKVILYYNNTRNRVEETIQRNLPYPEFVFHGGRFFKIYYPLGYFSPEADTVYYDEIRFTRLNHLKHSIRTKRR
jgi:hypothetical protein